jgi:glycosyltransferase involved in cell wall biosynthesis
VTVTPEIERLADRLRPAVPPERPLKVFFWPADVHSGCWEYRIRMQRDELLRLGHEVQTSQTLGVWPREEADVIVGQRICVTGPASQWLILAGQRRRPALVYEVDDDLFSIDPVTNPAGAVFRQPNLRQNMIDCIRAADLVTVSTEPLADVIRRWNPNVVVLPNCIPAATLAMTPPLRRGKDDGRVIFGWQGSPTHAEDWAQARDAVGDVLVADERAQLKMLGTKYFDGLPLLDDGRPGRLNWMDWTPDLDVHRKRVGRFDVSLAPLAPTVFNRSKSALRVIESYALGVPAVASDVPAYRGWVADGSDGFLVGNRRQWAEAMHALMDVDLRLDMGDVARGRAAAWTIEANIDKWISAYRAAVDGKEAA